MKGKLIAVTVLNTIFSIGFIMLIIGAVTVSKNTDIFGDIIDPTNTDGVSTLWTGSILVGPTGLAQFVLGIMLLVDRNKNGLIMADGICALLGIPFVSAIIGAVALSTNKYQSAPAQQYGYMNNGFQSPNNFQGFQNQPGFQQNPNSQGFQQNPNNFQGFQQNPNNPQGFQQNPQQPTNNPTGTEKK